VEVENKLERDEVERHGLLPKHQSLGEDLEEVDKEEERKVEVDLEEVDNVEMELMVRHGLLPKQ